MAFCARLLVRHDSRPGWNMAQRGALESGGEFAPPRAATSRLRRLICEAHENESGWSVGMSRMSPLLDVASQLSAARFSLSSVARSC